MTIRTLSLITFLGLGASQLFAATTTLTFDLISGVFSDLNSAGWDGDTYTQDGYQAQTKAAGNHLDSDTTLNWHNAGHGPNPTADNDVRLTFGGGAFDFLSFYLLVLYDDTPSLDITASNGYSGSFTTIGAKSLGSSISNVTWVDFSITDGSISDGGVALDDFEVRSSSVPDGGSTIALVGMTVLGLAIARRKLTN